MNEKPLAKVSTRVFATLIDYTIFFLFVFVYMIYFGEEKNGEYSVNGILALPIPILWFFYFVFTEGYWQATMGHQIFGIKICNENYKEIDVGHSFKRRILDIVDFAFFGIPAFLIIRSNKRKQRLGDLFAKTLVVKDI